MLRATLIQFRHPFGRRLDCRERGRSECPGLYRPFQAQVEPRLDERIRARLARSPVDKCASIEPIICNANYLTL
jgi:hypothetical protein